MGRYIFVLYDFLVLIRNYFTLFALGAKYRTVFGNSLPYRDVRAFTSRRTTYLSRDLLGAIIMERNQIQIGEEWYLLGWLVMICAALLHIIRVGLLECYQIIRSLKITVILRRPRRKLVIQEARLRPFVSHY